jgi:plasmid stabilization system protein ParE
MEIKIFWTDFAKSAVRSIFDYYLEHVSRNLARKLVIGIVAETKQLQYQPTMGTLEPLLEKDPRNFRYILYKSYKIIYWINEDRKAIEIVDVFDSRQNPIKISKSTVE